MHHADPSPTRPSHLALPHRALGMMAKYWVAGLVKTRLARDTGDEVAAAIHQHFTRRLTERLQKTADFPCVFVSPDGACTKMQGAIPSQWRCLPQGTGDLGQRMASALKALFSTGHSPSQTRAILIGADLPTLTPADVNAAFESLDKHDLVLGPADDGGYYLIGLQGPWRNEYQRLFQSIAWSTETVFKQTMDAAQAIRLRVATLGMREDIDNLETLQRLLQSSSTDDELKAAIGSLLAVPKCSTPSPSFPNQS